jgi:hypothetical protein
MPTQRRGAAIDVAVAPGRLRAARHQPHRDGRALDAAAQRHAARRRALVVLDVRRDPQHAGAAFGRRRGVRARIEADLAEGARQRLDHGAGTQKRPGARSASRDTACGSQSMR